MRHLGVLAAALALAGCANTAAFRTLATRTSAQLTTQEATMNNFVGAEKQLNQNNAALLDTLNAQAASEQAQSAVLVNAWTLGAQKDLLAAQSAAARPDAAAIVASLAVTRAAADSLDDGGAGAGLEKATGAYTALAKKPGFKAQAKEIFASGDAVYQAAEKLKQAAAAAPAAKPAAAAH